MNVENEMPMTSKEGAKSDAALSDYKTPERETKPLPTGTPGWRSETEKEEEK